MLIPKENEKDLAEIPDNVKAGLKIVPVASLDELLKQALVNPLVPIEWSEESAAQPVLPQPTGGEHPGVITH